MQGKKEKNTEFPAEYLPEIPYCSTLNAFPLNMQNKLIKTDNFFIMYLCMYSKSVHIHSYYPIVMNRLYGHDNKIRRIIDAFTFGNCEKFCGDRNT